ncbi:hypothetical protein [Polynucleobacter sp. UB-Tiil-W10]|uniref:hypothetical protein n=1 Tax=Polynucleobacter sp. UB-Tiil-W10 TaxID=1855648 RepID=UPI001C0C75C5|nr:hypothetical protein [Polynucleobacter sp. UB-Tiil-W10]MBU3540452.1 hypothetical protein [Polynucleobacter sp. UB-Tiil-W10]
MKYFPFLSLSFVSSLRMANGEETYKAPIVGDKKQWGKLIKEGHAHITSNGYYGVRAMHPKGGRPDLTVAEFASGVVYMANQAGTNWSEPDEAMLKDINKRIAKKLSKS